ncbi:hypothetical protein JJJ17_05225 [Paracoccus caeni]|uniref:Uncharacterized protein n=1 Tax=Paracoccus caeni TaxID=657651 RepID=A0A934SJ01_9RHOB|nr:hypothetical protein [Paracoccus caeni]MBK4215323.1 hypothetical protein [Paracoccus caeni]
MTRPCSAFVYSIYLLAFVVGFAIGAVFMVFFAGKALTSGTMLPVGPSVALSWISPLAGIAVFQLIFGFGTECWRGLRFWLLAPVTVYFWLAVFLAIFMSGYVNPTVAGIGAALAIFLSGAVALQKTLRR